MSLCTIPVCAVFSSEGCQPRAQFSMAGLMAKWSDVADLGSDDPNEVGEAPLVWPAPTASE
eukprot:6482077-Amphidinium_carterae.2